MKSPKKFINEDEHFVICGSGWRRERRRDD